MNEKGQMVAPATCRMTAKDFENKDGTSVYWIGGCGTGFPFRQRSLFQSYL